MPISRLKSASAIGRVRGTADLMAALTGSLLSVVLMTAAPVCSAECVDVNDAHLILVGVTSLNHTDRAVAALKAEHCAVPDDRTLRTVTYSSKVDEPISLVVVLDATSRMAARIEDARKGLAELFRMSNLQDQLGLVVIHDEPQIAVPLGGTPGTIERIADTVQANGFGAMWDGMYLGISELQKAHCRRKALVVISDGGDKYSRHTPCELMSLLKQADVQVYAIGMFDRYANRFQVRMRALQLDELTSATGGRVVAGNDFSRAAIQVSYELRHPVH